MSDVRKFLVQILVAAALVAVAATPAAARNAPVLKVDSVSAAILHHELVITATGAVKSGGWDAPCLRILRSSAGKDGVLVVHFLATPPAPHTVVIQALVPVKATLTEPVREDSIVWVKVVTETNDVQVAVKHK